ncbi:hypothetical protein [Bradyrhizobium sp. UFLA05-112]
MRLKVWFRVTFAPLVHANRTMKRSTRIFRDGTHKSLSSLPGAADKSISSRSIMITTRLNCGCPADKAGVLLTTEQIDGGGVSADSHSNLHGNVLLYENIAEIDDIAEIAEAKKPVMSMMPVMPVMPSTHSVEVRIDQFTHFTHRFPPQGLQSTTCGSNHTEGWLFYL